MAGVNKVIIVGHLGNDPEMRTMPNGASLRRLCQPPRRRCQRCAPARHRHTRQQPFRLCRSK